MAKPKLDETNKRIAAMKRLQDKKKVLEKKIIKRRVDIQTAEIANKADKRKVREIEMAMFALDEFFDMPRGVDGWKLYTGSGGGAAKIALMIAKELRNWLRWLRSTRQENKRVAFLEVVRNMEAFMEKYPAVGAADTVSRDVMIGYAQKYAHRLGYDVKAVW